MRSAFKKGHCYRLYDPNFGDEFIGVYMGREEGYSCMICGKGNNAHGFNVYQGRLEHPTKAEVQERINEGYETFFYGTEHLPNIIEEIE